MFDPQNIAAGKCYTDSDDLSRYVVEVVPAVGRKQSRVRWRRPGSFATKIETQTLSGFADAIVREDTKTSVDPASALPNDGMAVIQRE